MNETIQLKTKVDWRETLLDIKQGGTLVTHVKANEVGNIRTHAFFINKSRPAAAPKLTVKTDGDTVIIMNV
jgi:hypothetical protein